MIEPLNRHQKSIKIVLVILFLLIFLIGIVAILHAPGSLSVDSGFQVLEAIKGQSISWSPPFTSALIQWFGGKETGTTALLVFNAVLTYGSFGLVFVVFHCRNTLAAIPKWPFVILLILVLNPILLIYLGIIWKDVVISSFLSAILALTLVSSEIGPKWKKILLLIALILCSLLPLIRQQGLIVGPFIAIYICFCLCKAIEVRSYKKYFLVIYFAFYIACSMLSHWAVSSSIRPDNFRDYRTGFSEVFKYDLAGIWYFGDHSLPSINAVDFPGESIQNAYTGERIDILNLDPKVLDYFERNSPSSKDWLNAVIQQPFAYIKHRANVMIWLLGGHGISNCLPMISGVDLPSWLGDEIGIPNRFDRRNQAVLALSKTLEPLPIFRHWLYLANLVLCSIAVFFLKRARLTVGMAITVCWLYFLSFIPMGIACDFRYLYPLIPLLTLIDIVILGIGINLKTHNKQQYK